MLATVVHGGYSYKLRGSISHGLGGVALKWDVVPRTYIGKRVAPNM
jgi:hypothetical protein